MTFEVTKEEAKILMQLIYLGDTVKNGYRLPKEVSEPHRALALRLMETYMSEEGEEQCKLDDLYERLWDDTAADIFAYERSAVPGALGKMLASARYPGEQEGLRRLIAESFYTAELEKNGVKNVCVDLPDLDRKIGQAIGEGDREE